MDLTELIGDCQRAENKKKKVFIAFLLFFFIRRAFCSLRYWANEGCGQLNGVSPA